VTRQEQVFIISTQRRMNWLSHYVTRRWCDEARARGTGRGSWFAAETESFGVQCGERTGLGVMDAQGEGALGEEGACTLLLIAFAKPSPGPSESLAVGTATG
jgi:hypothetical protein